MAKVICPKKDCLFNFDGQCGQAEIQLEPYPGPGSPVACISETHNEESRKEAYPDEVDEMTSPLNADFDTFHDEKHW